MFKDMLFTVIISHLVSLAVAMTLVPVLASHYLPLTTRAEKPLANRVLAALDVSIGNGIESVKQAYLKFLTICLKHRTTTVAVIAALVVGSVVFFVPKLTIIFSPGMSDNSVTLDITEPLGTTFEATQEIINKFADIAETELKGIGDIIATTGSTGGFSSSSNSYSGTLTVNLADDTSKRIDNFATIKDKLRAHFKEYPNVSFSFEEGQKMSSRSDIDLTITSNNYTGMKKVANEIIALMKSDMPEILEPKTDTDNGLPQVEVEIDRARAASFGISVSTIATEIRDAIKGYESTVYREGGNEYSVWLSLQPSDRSKALDLNNIFVLSSSGDKIPLSSLATVTKGLGPLKIHRTNQSRTIDLTGNLAPGQQANKVEAKLQSLIKSNLTIPDDVYVTYTGSWSELLGQGASIIAIVLLALLLVWGAMAAQYESFKDPFINLTTIPVMLIGVFAMYYFMGQTISMYTLLGIIMLFGIVVNNGILMVDATNLSKKRGANLMEACLSGSASRFRPVLITAGATIMGEIPMAFFASENSSITQPIGLAVFGGMITATLITLIIVPVAYFIVNKGEAKRKGFL
jgi:HAE1 family hydrophobic/amphiphilic exporter-1